MKDGDLIAPVVGTASTGTLSFQANRERDLKPKAVIIEGSHNVALAQPGIFKGQWQLVLRTSP